MNQLNLGKKSVYREGYGIVGKAVMRDKTLSAESKAIYSYICSFAGSGTTAFPSAELMQHELNLSDNRFYKYRKELVDKGYITIIKQRNGNRREKNIYQIETEPAKILEHRQNKGVELEHRHFECIQNEHLQNEHLQNDGSNINSININSININNKQQQQNNNEEVKKLLSDVVVSSEEIIKIFNIARNLSNDPLNLIKEKVEVIKSGKYRNFVGSLITAMKDDWQMPKKTSKPGFNNFKPRDYDYGLLEKKLLGWEE